MKRVAIFGDVHGQSDQLKVLIEEVENRYPDIEWYSVGDLIDRGPDSKGVLQLCMDKKVKAIMGNHDQWIRELVTNFTFDPFCIKPIMGGQATLESFDVDRFSDGANFFPNGRPNDEVAMELIQAIYFIDGLKEWLTDLPPYRKIEVDEQTYWLLHAGLTSSNASSFKMATSSPITYCTDDEMMEKISQGDFVNNILWPTPSFGVCGRPDNLFHFENAIQIFGHKPIKDVLIKPHFIALDTGCGTCEPFRLSALILPEGEVFKTGEVL